MIAYRKAVQVLICDGCFSLLTPPGEDFHEGQYKWACADGRVGHVCNAECGQRFVDSPPAVAQAQVA